MESTVNTFFVKKAKATNSTKPDKTDLSTVLSLFILR